MKVPVNLIIDVDPDAWVANFGGDDVDTIKDVRDYTLYILRDELGAAEGVLPDGPSVSIQLSS